jgi:hypothetical protein
MYEYVCMSMCMYEYVYEYVYVYVYVLYLEGHLPPVLHGLHHGVCGSRHVLLGALTGSQQLV